MVPITRFVVEQIRELYASGLYHKADLAIRYSCYFEVPTDIVKVLTYEVFEDFREDLRMKIFAISYINMIKEEYQDTILSVAIENNDSPLKVSDEVLKETVKEAGRILEEKLLIINTEFGTEFSPFDLKSRIL